MCERLVDLEEQKTQNDITSALESLNGLFLPSKAYEEEMSDTCMK